MRCGGELCPVSLHLGQRTAAGTQKQPNVTSRGLPGGRAGFWSLRKLATLRHATLPPPRVAPPHALLSVCHYVLLIAHVPDCGHLPQKVAVVLCGACGQVAVYFIVQV